MSRRMGALLVVISVVAGVLAALGIHAWIGESDPKSADPTPSVSATGTTAPARTPGHGLDLADSNLVLASNLAELPLWDGSHPEAGPEPWEEFKPTDDPTLACQRDWLKSLGPEQSMMRDFTTHPNEAGGGGIVRTAVLKFEQESEATSAYDAVVVWLAACGDGQTLRPDVTVEGPDEPVTIGGGRGFTRLVSYPAPDVCTADCLARWHDRLFVAQVGDRVLVASHAEFGDPAPEGFEDRARYDLDQVISAGV